MKILFVSSDIIPHIGGKSTHVLDLADGFKSLGIECEIISLGNVGKFVFLFCKTCLLPLRIVNQELYIYQFKKWWARLLNNMVFEYCSRNKVDFLSVQDAWAAYSISKTIQKLHVPAILTMHTYFGLENALDRKTSYLKRAIYENMLSCEISALEFVDGTIAVDDRIKNHVENELKVHSKKNDSKKVASIFNFTNTKSFRPANSDEKLKYRQECGIEENQFVVICARRLVEKNGVINLVKAMKYVTDKDIRVLIAGDGPQKQAIKKYIKENSLDDTVKLLGSVNSEEVRKLYMASDISVVPSVTANGLQEATSISAIEAMACGLPTIASDIGGLSQIIDNDETGVLVDEGNAQQIAEAIGELKNNSKYYLSIKKKARTYIEENHSHVESAKKYLAEFERYKNK